MNALTVEQAFKEAAAGIYAPLPGYCGTSGEVVTTAGTIVVFLCEDLTHRSGPYWIGLLKVEVDAPAIVEGSINGYAATWTALHNWFNDREAVDAMFPINGVRLNGFYVMGAPQGPRDERWIGSIVVKVGLQRAE